MMALPVAVEPVNMILPIAGCSARETFDLTDGSMASFNKGAKTRWTILKPTVEFFVYS